MNIDKNLSSPSDRLDDSLTSLTAISSDILAIADRSSDDVLALLHLLRTLEQLHHQIQADYFQAVLPDSRQSLYALLREIEENGGWPYIQRFKLQALCANLREDLPTPPYGHPSQEGI
jgi:hypothetical protein